MNKEITVNEAQRLYVIPEGNGYSCLGFDVCETRRERLARELADMGITPPLPETVGSLDNYRSYKECCDLAQKCNQKTGYRFKCELHPALIGFDGRRVEVEYGDGRKEKFWVGKSTGWVPCHLRIASRRENGGDPISRDEHIVRTRIIK